MHKFEIAIRWKNFRCFKDTKWISIKPLTILIGPNNTGKSSLSYPLLALKQTIEAADAGIPLMTKGDLVNIGSFNDFIYSHNKELPLEFSIRFHTHASKKDEEMTRLGSYPPGAISISFVAKEDVDPSDIELYSYKVFDVINRLLLERKRKISGGFSYRFYPNVALEGRVKTLIMNDVPINFLFTDFAVNKLLQELINEDHSEEYDEPILRTVELDQGASLYFSVVSIAFSQARNFFEDISFIGPLRALPKRLYEFSGEPPNDVGPKGENTPEVIARGLDSECEKWVQKWVNEFEFGGVLKSTISSHNIFKLEVGTKKKGFVNLADTGAGLSQVLPLIVEGATCPKGNLIITEQPEIHLNPKLQLKLADLFVAIANNNKRVIVETHSEHLLMRVRRLVSDGKISPDNVGIYFIEKGREESIVREIPLKSNGHFEKDSWPKGFFEDSLREAIGLASSQSRG